MNELEPLIRMKYSPKIKLFTDKLSKHSRLPPLLTRNNTTNTSSKAIYSNTGTTSLIRSIYNSNTKSNEKIKNALVIPSLDLFSAMY